MNIHINHQVKWHYFKHIVVLCAIIVLIGFISIHIFSSQSKQKDNATIPTSISENKFESTFEMQFEQNKGQTAKEVKFLSRGAGFVNFLTKNGNVLKLRKHKDNTSTVLSITFKKSNEDVEIVSDGQPSGVYNYFIGNDPSKWLSGVATFPTIRYNNLYDNVDAIYSGMQDKLDYDFEVRPGGKPEHITFIINGVSSLSISDNGELIMNTQQGIITMDKPHAFQMVDGVKREVSIEYELKDNKKKSELSFKVGKYDKDLLLNIDPVLVFSSYIGGTSADVINAVKVDIANNIYITGYTESIDFPTTNGTVFGAGTNGDAFIAKISTGGAAMVFATYIGGTGTDTGTSIAVDSSNNIYIGGVTYSTDFPNSNAVQTSLANGTDMFVAKLNSTGSTLIYSTYLGGGGDDANYGIGVDSLNNTYVLGQTTSTNYPTVSPIQGTYRGQGDFILTKLNSAGSSIVYSTYLGGTGSEYNPNLAVDSTGNAYVAGITYSSDLPVVNAVQPTIGGINDGFVAKINSAGSAISYLTYLGGSDRDQLMDIKVDSSGNAYVVGITESPNFPTLNPIQASLAGGEDAFITKINSTGNAFVYSTYFGGSASDQGVAIAVNSSNQVFFTGTTYSSNFPVVNSLQAVIGGEADAFVVKLNSAGSSVLISTYFGGSGFEDVSNFALTSTLNLGLLVGSTQSSDFPTKLPLSIFKDGGGDGFVVIMNLSI